MNPNKATSIEKFFDNLAPERDYWIAKNKYYYSQLFNLHKWLVEKGSIVLDIGCGTGDLLSSVLPKNGVGIDASFEMVKRATKKYPHYKFQVMDAHHLELKEQFDYILLSNLVGYLDDIWQVLRNLRKVSHERTRIIITNYNYLWQPLMAFSEKLHLKMPDRIQNWLPQQFIEHFLYLCGFEVVKKGKYLHIPIDIPYFSNPLNKIFSNLPLIDRFGLIEYIVARPSTLPDYHMKDTTVSVIVPTYKEAGNIKTIVERMPHVGTKTELIFVDLPGGDGTKEAIQKAIKDYKGRLSITYVQQEKKTGKIGALRLGVKNSQGQIIIIYDADVTIPPEDIEKIYLALLERKGEFINGTRLVYPTEKGAMRFLNHLGNTLFANLFTWGLGQHFTDTLCGTKGFWREDFYHFEDIKTKYDNLDRYGDLYLLLSAYRKNLKIAEVPLRYKIRRYGDTKMDRFKNGFQFLLMFIYFLWHVRIMKKSFKD